jgi:hypothetical protein
MTFQMLKLSNNRHLVPDYASHVEAYIDNIAAIVNNIERKPNLSIEAKRIEFTQAVLLDVVVMVQRFLKEDSVKASDSRVFKVLQFVI